MLRPPIVGTDPLDGDALPAAAAEGEADGDPTCAAPAAAEGTDDGEAAEAAPDPDDPAPDPELLPLATLQLPVGGVNGPLPFFCTTAPASGKARSVLSAVWQSPDTLWIFATNILGRVDRSRFAKKLSSESYATVSFVSRFFEPPVTVMGAQFMYISRFPILLNQVHASV